MAITSGMLKNRMNSESTPPPALNPIKGKELLRNILSNNQKLGMRHVAEEDLNSFGSSNILEGNSWVDMSHYKNNQDIDIAKIVGASNYRKQEGVINEERRDDRVAE